MEPALPNLRHLRAFAEAESQRSIRRAAEAVYLSQPAVTQAIAKLEQSFGMPFFDRTSTGVMPTPAGVTYANRVRRALALIEQGVSEALRLAAGRGPRPAGHLLALLTTTQLRAFVAVGTTGNLTLAARAIGTSQPAVHRSTRELEAVLDAHLFDRTSRGISLTRPGQALWHQLKLAFVELDQGALEVQAHAGLHSGTIVAGCLPLSRHRVMPEAITEFCGLYPTVNVSVIESPYPDLLHALRHGELDLLLGALRESLPFEDVEQESLFPARLCVAARHGHPLGRKRSLSIADLAAYPWVLPPRATPTRDRFERLFSRQPQAGKVGLIESSSQVLIRGLLLDSDRLTLISTHQVQLEVELGLLIALNFEVKDSKRWIGVTTRRNWQPTAPQRDFLETLRRVSARHSEHGLF